VMHASSRFNGLFLSFLKLELLEKKSFQTNVFKAVRRGEAIGHCSPRRIKCEARRRLIHFIHSNTHTFTFTYIYIYL